MELSPYEKQYKFCPTCKTTLELKSVEGKKRLYCGSCKFTYWNNPKPCVSVIIEQKGKVLMLQRSKEPLIGYWCLPGGFVDYEESPEEAVKREAEEETGKKITLGRLVGIYRVDSDPRGVHLDIIYEGTLQGLIEVSSEHTKSQFFEPQYLPTPVAYRHAEAITDWFKK